MTARWILCSVFVLCATIGCTPVPAHQRGRLAHPTMQLGYGRSSGRDHLYAIHEGARGGAEHAASGCGCN